MDKLSIKEGRKQLKALGYTLHARANPFKSELKTLGFSGNGAADTSGGNVFPAEFYNKHKSAFEILNRIEANADKAPNKVMAGMVRETADCAGIKLAVPLETGFQSSITIVRQRIYWSSKH